MIGKYKERLAMGYAGCVTNTHLALNTFALCPKPLP